jgi:DNA-binding NtrC family response regulator
VEYAKDGVEAIGIYRSAKEKGQSFSAVILDVNIPDGMGGKETMKELLAIDPHVKGIIACGYLDDQSLSEFRKFGFYGAVEVSFDIEKMKDILDDLLK